MHLQLTCDKRMYSIPSGLRCVPSILLLLSVAAFGSGGLRYAHELEHLNGHAHARAAHVDDHDSSEGHAAHGTADPDHEHAPAADPGGRHHDDAPNPDPADCFIHSQLNLPLHDAGHVPVLVCVGRFVPFPDLPPNPAIRSRRPTLPLDSRGPPAPLNPLPQRLA